MFTLSLSGAHTLMERALLLAEDATPLDVPVGALILDAHGTIIGQGVNTRERDNDLLGHAELNAMKQATQHLHNWRLTECTLIVTLEPCAMCAAALAQSRIGRIVYGASDTLAGGCGGSHQHLAWPCPPELRGGILEDQCASRLRQYFQERR
jgi:tRNA(adenine34) deaminase